MHLLISPSGVGHLRDTSRAWGDIDRPLCGINPRHSAKPWTYALGTVDEAAVRRATCKRCLRVSAR